MTRTASHTATESMRSPSSRPGFTLIEVVVAITLTAIVLAIAAAALSAATSARARCPFTSRVSAVFSLLNCAAAAVVVGLGENGHVINGLVSQRGIELITIVAGDVEAADAVVLQDQRGAGADAADAATDFVSGYTGITGCGATAAATAAAVQQSAEYEGEEHGQQGTKAVF